jgi:flagellar protein FlgJ
MPEYFDSVSSTLGATTVRAAEALLHALGDGGRETFLRQATAAALAASAVSRFPAGITVAQAALESAYGSSQLARDANNYFGIKARGGRPFIELPATEVLNGAAHGVTARFALYASMAECFADRDAILCRVSLYSEARAAAGDPEAFTRALAQHWATDPAYAEKILLVYRAQGLAALDRK